MEALRGTPVNEKCPYPTRILVLLVHIDVVTVYEFYQVKADVSGTLSA